MSNAIHLTDSLVAAGNLSIAVISPDDLSRNEAVMVIGECHHGPIREIVSYPHDLNDVTRMLGHKFDVVIVDMDSDPEYAINLVEEICTHGMATVMVYSAHADPEILVRCMRAGAREFLTVPFTRGSISDALVRAFARHVEVLPTTKKDGSLLVFLSAKGGSGVTTLACNFAVSLAQQSGKKTLLIDLNLPLGDAAINLGIKSQFSTVNALQNVGRLDASFFSHLLVEHSSGLFVLAAPSEMAPTLVTDDAIDRMLEVALEEFDYVVVDAGSRLNIQGTALFDKSATVYMVTQVGIPELRNSNRLISRFSAPDSPRLEIVVNRFEPGSMGIDEEHIEKALTKPVQWKIPNDYAAVRKMQNTATPLTQDNTPISNMIQKMARSFCGIPEVQEKKKKFGIFG